MFCRRGIYLLIVLNFNVAGFAGEHIDGLLLIKSHMMLDLSGKQPDFGIPRRCIQHGI